MNKVTSTAFFFLVVSFLVYLSVLYDDGRAEKLTMDEAVPANSFILENKMEGSPPEDVDELPRIVVSNVKDSFILREAVPDPVRAPDAPLPPPEALPVDVPATIVVVIVPEEPVDVDPAPPTTDEPVPTTEPPVETTEPPVTTTDPPVTTEPPVTTTDPVETTTEEPTTTTEEPDPVCLIGLELDHILGVCVPI